MGRKVTIGLDRRYIDGKGKAGVLPTLLDRLNEMADVEYQRLSGVSPEVRPEQIEGFDIVLPRISAWTQDSLVGNSQLLCVIRLGVGYDTIDVPALTEAGVMLTITPEAVRRPVAVGIITFILALSTRLLTKNRLVREGRWERRFNYLGYGLTGKTLGSVGVGNIGHEMFRLAKPFGMKHIAYDPYVRQETLADVDVRLVDMDTVLVESDFLNISCPLNETTYHLIGEKELAKMKESSFLINNARGPIVEEAALIKALDEGWIRGAAQDVFEQEPTPPENPLLKMDVDKVIFTPHSMSITDEFLAIGEAQMLRQIAQIIRGDVPEALVNPEAWDRPEFQSKLKRFQASVKG